MTEFTSLTMVKSIKYMLQKHIEASTSTEQMGKERRKTFNSLFHTISSREEKVAFLKR